MKTLNIVLTVLLLTVFGTSYVLAEPLPVVDVVMAKEQPLIYDYRSNGHIFGKRNTTLTATQAGRLEYVAEPGMAVAEGTLIARIDTTELTLQHAEQNALLRRAETNLVFLQKELARLDTLSSRDAAAKSAFDQTQNQVELAQADIDIAKIRLELLEEKIERANVYSPFAGIVSERFAMAGQEIQRATQLVHLIDTEQQELRLFVPIAYFTQINVGQSLQISQLDNDFQTSIDTIITSVIPMTAMRTQMFEVIARLELSTSRQWTSGQMVDVILPIKQFDAITQVHQDTILLNDAGTFVVTVNSEGTVERVAVNIVGTMNEYVGIEVLSGKRLVPGTHVAIRGAEGLQSGQKVEIIHR